MSAARTSNHVMKILLLGPILLFVMVGLLIHFSDANRSFRKLRMGMDRSQVEKIMGKPERESLDVTGFCKAKYLYRGCEGKESEITLFLMWTAGIDSFYLVGLDKSGKVVFFKNGDL
jgi:hypothetical protein